jgi:DNA-binding MarR family transcriptional regulator
MDNQYTNQLATFINDIRGMLPENSRELLLGGSGSQLTGTQGHVLMLLADTPAMTNGELAKALSVSQAAVTKAMRGLSTADPALAVATVDARDARVKAWSLTDAGQSFAAAHRQRHAETAAAYAEILDEFSESEQATISRFLTVLLKRLQEE